MVYFKKTTQGFVSRTLRKNHYRFTFKTFITFSVSKSVKRMTKRDVDMRAN